MGLSTTLDFCISCKSVSSSLMAQSIGKAKQACKSGLQGGAACAEFAVLLVPPLGCQNLVCL